MKSRLLFSPAIAVFLGIFAVSAEASKGKAKNLKVRTTAYTHSEADHIQYGRKTAAGGRLQCSRPYTSAAADWSRFPLGTTFKIKGLDSTFVVDDYGRALVGTDTIDLYHPSRGSMDRWGVRHVDIEIVEFGDYEKSKEILKDRTKYAHVRKMLAGIPKDQPDGLLGRLLPKNKAKTETSGKKPASTVRQPKPAPSAPVKASAPQPQPALLASAPVQKKKPTAPIKKTEPQSSLAPAWEDPAPKSAPVLAANPFAALASVDKYLSAAAAVAEASPSHSPVPTPPANLPKPKPRKFVPLEIASLDLPPRPAVSEKKSKPAKNHRVRRFRPLPASWQPDV